MTFIEEMAKLVDSEAEKIATEEIAKFKEAHPGCIINDEIRTTTVQRANAQLSFNIAKLHVNKDGDLQEQFDDWFKGQIEEDLHKACEKCLAEETEKLSNNSEESLTYLQKYMKQHGIDI